MNPVKRVRQRGAIIGLAAVLVVLAALPLMGTAQDATPAVSEEDLIAQGEEIYANVCIACHQPGGAGIAGIYPALNGNPLVTLEDPSYIVGVLINGRGGMPMFASTYDDQELTAIATYIRQAWDNEAAAVDPALVAQLRAESEEAPVPDATPEPETQSEAADEGESEATPDS